jgi:predicted secreted protein
MASKAVSTVGVKLKRGDGATPTEVFSAIGEVFNLSGPNETAAQIDVTSFDSTAREYIAGLRDGGEVTFEFNFVGDDVSQAGLRSDFAAGTLRNFEIDLHDATATLTVPSKYAFAASVTALGNSFAVDDKITGSCTLKISGPVTFTPRAAA